MKHFRCDEDIGNSGGGNSEPPEFLLGESMEGVKGEKVRHQKMSPPGQQVSKIKLPGKSRETAPERRKRLGQSGNNTQLWMCLVMKAKS